MITPKMMKEKKKRKKMAEGSVVLSQE